VTSIAGSIAPVSKRRPASPHSTFEVSSPGEDVSVNQEPTPDPTPRSAFRQSDELDGGHKDAHVAIHEAFDVPAVGSRTWRGDSEVTQDPRGRNVSTRTQTLARCGETSGRTLNRLERRSVEQTARGENARVAKQAAPTREVERLAGWIGHTPTYACN
jgi:hypothetical protein